MADLLLELFSEEIPARMQLDAVTSLQIRLFQALEKAGFNPTFGAGGSVDFVTPRRIAVWAQLPHAQPDVTTELKGPKIGAPQQAIDGFLKKSGMTLDQLTQQDGIYLAKIHQKGRPTADLLKDLIEDILKYFPWPKSMRWGANETSWVRPLHSILCIFDGKVVPVEFAGVKAGNFTFGHRFLSPGSITITNAGDYEAALEKAYVIADRDKRKAEILKQAEAAASAQKLNLKKDEGLLEEVTGLVEYPVILTGTIDKNYMDLPKEVLVSEMRAHQKYFALENADGSLADKFLITANIKTADAGRAIIAGNERVLRARLADGRFFWDQDRKKKLEDMAEGLKTVTYHAKLGSVADKVTRIKALARVILSEAKDPLQGDPSHALAMPDMVERAAALCKADLVSGMVGEFPELQGTMGRYYALHQGEKPEIADAIRDHYKPQGPSDSVPQSPTAICVALADKLDTLISLFAIGEKPTGSKDPFALRRAALGVIRIILENNIRLPLKSCFAAVPAKAIALHMSQEKLAKQTEAKLHEAPAEHKVGKYLTVNESACTDVEEAVPANLTEQLHAFFIDRLIVQLKDSGIRHDIIKAVVAGGDDDLVRIVARAKAVQEFLATDDGKNLLAGYKRAANIVAIEEKKDGVTYTASSLNPDLLQEEEEKKLSSELGVTDHLLKQSLPREDYKQSMTELAFLRRWVDRFFEKIMVNCDDTILRKERLHLLARIRDCMYRVADFGEIEK